MSDTGRSTFVGTDTIIAAKGDLIVGTANDTAAVLSVGSNDQILMAESAQTTGLQWVSSAAPGLSTAALATGTTDGFARPDHTHDSLYAVVASIVTHAQSSVTQSNITGLTFNISASATEIWLVQVFLELTAADTASDVAFGWGTMPTSATMRWGGMSGGSTQPGGYTDVGAATTVVTMISATGLVTLGTAGVTAGYAFAGKVYGGGTAGAIQMTFAQGTSTASDISVLAGSCLIATKLVA